MYRYALPMIIALILCMPNMANAACPSPPPSGATDMIMRFVPPSGGHAGTMSSAAITDKTLEGTLIYDTANKTLKLCNGTTWLPLHNPITASGTAGQIQFNDGFGSLAASPLLVWDDINRRVVIGSSGRFVLEAASESPNSGFLRFGDNTGWKFHVGRRNNAYGAPLNTGVAGVIMTVVDQGVIGIMTTTPAATLDINGYTRLAMNASAPATCAATNRGAIALTSTAQMCICTPSGWQVANTTTLCAW